MVSSTQRPENFSLNYCIDSIAILAKPSQGERRAKGDGSPLPCRDRRKVDGLHARRHNGYPCKGNPQHLPESFEFLQRALAPNATWSHLSRSKLGDSLHSETQSLWPSSS